MSDAAAPQPARIALVPRRRDRTDRALWILLAASLTVHVLIALPSLIWQHDTASKPPAEIPVEVVQLPPEKPRPAAKQAGKPPVDAKKAEPPKVREAKHEEAPKPPEKPAAAHKNPAPKAAAPKPEPQKPMERAHQDLKPTPQQAETQKRMAALLGGMDAIALPGASAVGTDSVSYDRLVLSQVAKAKKEGRYPGIPGYATVAFTLGDKGEVATCEVRRPSGDPALDAEAVAMIHRGEPYPPPPPGGRRDYVITLSFQAT